MPVYVFTYHTYQSWMPDHPKGYVQRKKGILPPDEDAARQYRDGALHEPFTLSEDDQRLVINEARRACEFQGLRLHFVATEPTHLHVLVSWSSDKPWEKARTGVKQSLTRALRKRAQDVGEDRGRPFFSDGSSRKRIAHQGHFDYWVNDYGPSHGGWKWCEERGMFR